MADTDVRFALEGDQTSPVGPLRNLSDPGAPTSQPPQAPTAGDAEAAIRERERVKAIHHSGRVLAAQYPNARMLELAMRLADEGKSVEEARGVLIEWAAKSAGNSQGPVYGPARVMSDEADHLRDGIEGALLHRVDPVRWPLSELGRLYAHQPLLEYGRMCIQQAGGRTTGMSANDVAGAAINCTTDLQRRAGMHTTSDYPYILDNVAKKILATGYAEAPQTFAPIATVRRVSDFKTVSEVERGHAPSLLEVGEGGEIQAGTIAEGREQWALKTYARIFKMSRRMIVNDDLQAFGDVVTDMARAARNLESDLAWAQIIGNGLMADGVAIFDAAHGNLAGSGAAIDVASLGAARAAMRRQMAPGGEQYLNLQPRFLAVPPEKETLAQQYTMVTSGQQVLTPSGPTNLNPFGGALTVLAEPRLTGTAWYVFADPNAVPILSWGLLLGQEGPRTESQAGFNVEGIEIKVVHDCAFKVTNYRGAYKNPGA